MDIILRNIEPKDLADAAQAVRQLMNSAQKTAIVHCSDGASVFFVRRYTKSITVRQIKRGRKR